MENLTDDLIVKVWGHIPEGLTLRSAPETREMFFMSRQSGGRSMTKNTLLSGSPAEKSEGPSSGTLKKRRV